MQRWLFDWQELAAQLSAEDRYIDSSNALLVKVISLQRTENRKSRTVSSLNEQGVPHAIFEAIDGLAGFSDETLTRYAGRRTRERLQKLSAKNYEDALQAHRNGVMHLFDGSLRASIHDALRLGCFLSHVTLWQEISELTVPYMVILEDDAVISSNFSRRLHDTLEYLPESWDFLFLNGCYKKIGPDFAPGVKLSRGSLCTFGYAVSLSAAKKLLSGSSLLHSDKPIDHVLDAEIVQGKLFSFHAEPPLVDIISTMESTLGY